MVTDYGGGLLLPLVDQVLECADNTLLWAGSPSSLDDWLGDDGIDSDGLTPAGRLAALSYCFTLLVKPDTQSQTDFLAEHFDPLVAAWKQSHPAALDPEPQPECNDGLDNDGDEHVDAGDPGCASSGDLSEQSLVQCDDGGDNDDDGLVDMQDPNCRNPSDNRERRSIGTSRCGNGIRAGGSATGRPVARAALRERSLGSEVAEQARGRAEQQVRVGVPGCGRQNAMVGAYLDPGVRLGEQVDQALGVDARALSGGTGPDRPSEDPGRRGPGCAPGS